MVFPLLDLCMLRQACIGCTNADVCLINLDMYFNCTARCIVYQRTSHALGAMDFPWEKNTTAAYFLGQEFPLRSSVSLYNKRAHSSQSVRTYKYRNYCSTFPTNKEETYPLRSDQHFTPIVFCSSHFLAHKKGSLSNNLYPLHSSNSCRKVTYLLVINQAHSLISSIQGQSCKKQSRFRHLYSVLHYQYIDHNSPRMTFYSCKVI